MFTSIDNFCTVWQNESQATARLLENLTDASLLQPKMNNVRNVGRAAWHIVTTLPEMGERIGIKVEGVKHTDPVPTKAAAILEAYRKAAKTILDTVRKWPETDLYIEDDMYGMTWKRGQSLWGVVAHEIHHRGQLTVLMRLAGLPVSGVYGPSQEEWAKIGVTPPQI